MDQSYFLKWDGLKETDLEKMKMELKNASRLKEEKLEKELEKKYPKVHGLITGGISSLTMLSRLFRFKVKIAQVVMTVKVKKSQF